MEQYILKSALVAGIEARIKDIEVSQKVGLIKKRDANKKILLLKSVLLLIDTLEVKEVNLEKEIDLVEDKYHGFESLSRADIIEIIKHFFELGMAVSNKAQKGEEL